MESISLKARNTDRQDGGTPSPDNDDYDPHLHRNVPKATSNFETLVHILKGSLGTGILAMPQAFYNSGLINGILSTAIIGFLATYCLHILVKQQYILCKRSRLPLLTYPQSMKLALQSGPKCLRWFAEPSVLVVDIFLVIYQLGICCVYIVFIGESVKKICDPYYDMKIEIYMLMLLLPLIAINCIRNLKLLAPFSSLANVMTFIGIGIVIYYLVTDVPPLSRLSMWGTLYTYPLYFGTTLFALEAVGVVIALENNMKNPKSFGGYFGVLNIGMIIIVVLYIIMGMLGYMKYGSAIEASVTLNLPTGPLAETVKAMFALAIYISYGLQCYPPIEILWKTYIVSRLENSNRKLIWEYALRIGIVFVTFAFAIAIPRLGLFITLFGAFCLSALGLAFPALMELCVNHPDNHGRLYYIFVKDILLIIFGIIGLLVGTTTALIEIVRSFK